MTFQNNIRNHPNSFQVSFLRSSDLIFHQCIQRINQYDYNLMNWRGRRCSFSVNFVITQWRRGKITYFPKYSVSRQWTCLAFRLMLQWLAKWVKHGLRAAKQKSCFGVDNKSWQRIASEGPLPGSNFFLGDTWPAPTRVSPLSLPGTWRGETLGTRLV